MQGGFQVEIKDYYVWQRVCLKVLGVCVRSIALVNSKIAFQDPQLDYSGTASGYPEFPSDCNTAVLRAAPFRHASSGWLVQFAAPRSVGELRWPCH